MDAEVISIRNRIIFKPTWTTPAFDGRRIVLPNVFFFLLDTVFKSEETKHKSKNSQKYNILGYTYLGFYS